MYATSIGYLVVTDDSEPDGSYIIRDQWHLVEPVLVDQIFRAMEVAWRDDSFETLARAVVQLVKSKPQLLRGLSALPWYREPYIIFTRQVNGVCEDLALAVNLTVNENLGPTLEAKSLDEGNLSSYYLLRSSEFSKVLYV